MADDNSAALAALLAAARPHIRATCRRKLWMFAAYPDLAFDDLMSEGNKGLIEAVRRGQGPRSGKFSTWVGMVAGRRLLDLSRVRARGLAREKVVKEDAAAAGVAVVQEGEERVGDATDLAARPGETLAEWAERVYEWARARWPRQAAETDRGRELTVPQRTALLAILRGRGLSVRGLAMLLEQRPGLRRALDLRWSPSPATLARLAHDAAEAATDDEGEKSVTGKRGLRRVESQKFPSTALTAPAAPDADPVACFRAAAGLDDLRRRLREANEAGYTLNPEEAAAALDTDPATLAAWRREGHGPPFVTIRGDVVRYRRADLDAFATTTTTPAGAVPPDPAPPDCLIMEL